MDTKVISFWERELRDMLKKDALEKIELFFEFLEMQKKESKNHSDIVTEKILNTLEDYANGEISLEQLLKTLLLTEQYLGTLCFYVDKGTYSATSSSEQKFGDLIKWIGDYQLTKNGGLGIGTDIIEETEKFDIPKKFWAQAYWARNQDAHSVINVNMKWKSQIVYAILYVMITSTWKFKKEVEKVISETAIRHDFDTNAYFKKIIREYESANMQKTFVEMKSVVYDVSRNENCEGDKKEEILPIIDLITKKNVGEQYCKLVGEAGLGKSRLMRHLEYMDAKERKVIPIYIELRELVEVGDSITQLLAERLGVKQHICEKILNEMDTHLYLDGVNEMLCSDKEKFLICKRLDNLTELYPNAKILISDRENSAVTVSNKIPTYLLCKLDKKMMKQFIDLNSSPEVVDVVHQLVETNEKIVGVVSTPIMLIFLIKMVEEGNYDSSMSTEKEIVACYVKGLLEREVREKGETRAKKIEYLLSSLAISEASSNNELSYYEEANVLREFKKCADTYGISGVDMLEMIELVTQMGLMKVEKNGEIYAFANQKLEEYFFDYALEKGMIDYE